MRLGLSSFIFYVSYIFYVYHRKLAEFRIHGHSWLARKRQMKYHVLNVDRHPYHELANQLTGNYQ